MSQISDQLTTLEAAVAANTDAEQSAIILLQKIPQLIIDAGNGSDPDTVARLKAAADAITAQSAALAAAVVANTPVIPPPGFVP